MATSVLPRHLTRLLAAGIVAALLAATAPAVAATPSRWIVPRGTALPTGATVVGAFPLADALVVDSPAPVHGGVSFDAPIGLQSLPPASEGTELRVDSGVGATDADQVWAHGELGDRAVVALIDSGVADVPALEGAVVGEIDFSGTGGGDGYGHGTFLASLIAGAGPVAPGVAPHAGILSLKVAGPDGSTTLGSVLAALQWLHRVGRLSGVRIATLALGADPDTDAARMLDMASDAVAGSGVLVVTASGNEGEGNVTSPATAAETFSVGAFNDAGTAARDDDTSAEFSGTGPDRVGVMQPDITASGVAVVGSMPADATIAVQNPTAFVEGGLFRGSGTSMSTALTAGVAALASSARPDLDGGALAAALRAGDGIADAPTAVAAAQAAAPGKPLPKPPWADKVTDHPGQGQAKGKGKNPPSQVDPQGLRWAGLRWAGLRWAGLRWAGLRWTGLRWAELDWKGLRWAGLRWAGTHWGDETWAPGAWGGLRWTGRGWAGDELDPEWTGLRWAGLRWAGLRWAGLRWAGLRWAGLRWAMLEAPSE